MEDELFEQVKPGLSGHYKKSEDVSVAVDSLKPLLEKAIARVPEDQRRCVPIALKATAGLRLLGAEKSELILAGVRKLFKDGPFFLPDQDAVSLMGGSDEALFGWMTVNFLLDNLGSQRKQTAAIIDMGGGSTQVVFEPGSTAMSTGPSGSATKLRYNGRTFQLYEHSHLGYGLMEARKKIEKAGGCDKDFSACHTVAKGILKKDAECATKPCSFNGIWQPPLAKFSGEVYAFSYYYDRMEDKLPEDGKITVGKLKEAAVGDCPKAADMECKDLAYLYSVVSTGYDLPDDTTLHVNKKIKGIETAWTLGAILTQLDS